MFAQTDIPSSFAPHPFASAFRQNSLSEQISPALCLVKNFKMEPEGLFIQLSSSRLLKNENTAASFLYSLFWHNGWTLKAKHFINLRKGPKYQA